MNTNTIRVLFVLGTILIVGCKNGEKPKLSVNDKFESDAQPRSINTLFDQQAAIGARQDGTLYAAHFTDGQLNSLGTTKLNAMLSGPERGMVNIYLSIPKDNAYGTRESSVIAHLSALGLASNSYTLTAGDNMNLGTPAVQGLNGLAKQNTATEAAGATPGAAPSK